ncbi:glutathione S-transferase-like protein [Mycena alexandri]|uniref:glutathione transferase n=1 Tax=Mycena alexandri TaxID=1745969 RepID=A0AAD6X042_9AGAR|nr:glutathione S-transferase-like protein [Mycena alexandri]KAJ7033825.1 glutathione S-transferase-like protein [Mycena alexandri]
MVLKVYVAPLPSGGSPIVLLVLAEKQIPFECIFVELTKKETKTSDFLKMNPFGQVPVIDDDGFILYETRAICRYLTEKYAAQGPALIPTSLNGKAVLEQAASVELATFMPALIKVGREALKGTHGLAVDQAVLDAALVEFGQKLDVYEVILGKHKFIAGDELTIVDFFHLIYAPGLATRVGIDIMTQASRPNVTRWWNVLIARPAWVKLQAERAAANAVQNV